MAMFRMKSKRRNSKKGDTKDKGVKTGRPFFNRKIPFFVISLIAASLILYGCFALFLKAPYFDVQHVIMVGKEPASSVNYADLERMMLDKNIFTLNLAQIRAHMLEKYPELLDLRLERTFPNSVAVVITLRKPIVQFFKESYYPVDQDGIILSGAQNQPQKNLPIVHGVRLNLAKFIGQKPESRRIQKALLLLKELKTSGLLRKHTLVEIDVSSLRNVIFFLEDGLEIKIGHDNFASRLANLYDILSDPKVKPADIRYIDLRFKEPVIGPKWKR